MTKRLRDLLRALPRQSQRGFTLIEMLVVISILGILAAVVTMSMVGVTKIAQDNADQAEKKTVQVALDTMAAEQQLSADSVCTGAITAPPGTNQMDQFPVSGSTTAAPGTAVPLYPHYLHGQKTSRNYICTSTGEVEPTS